MSEVLKQSTAVSVLVGPCLDADGVAVTTLVVGNFKISVNGGAPGALNGSATATHRHTGHYSIALTTSDVATVGTADITLDATTNAMQPARFQVVEEAVYDALFAASAPGYVANAPVNLAQIGGDAQSMTDLKDFADAGYDPSTNKVQGLVLADAVTGVPTLTQILAAFGGVTGAVEDEAGNSSTVFQTNLAETADDYYNGGSLVFTSGTNIGQVRKISDYTGSTGTVTVGTAFDDEPGTGDQFLIVGRIQ